MPEFIFIGFTAGSNFIIPPGAQRRPSNIAHSEPAWRRSGICVVTAAYYPAVLPSRWLLWKFAAAVATASADWLIPTDCQNGRRSRPKLMVRPSSQGRGVYVRPRRGRAFAITRLAACVLRVVAREELWLFEQPNLGPSN
jgi:hypothetical protein